MRNKNGKIATILIAALALFAGCGPNGSRNDFNPALPPQSGPIGNAPGGQTGPGGCIALNSRVQFNGTNIYVDSHNIMGGLLPGDPNAYGTITVGGTTGGVSYSGESMDGLLQMGFTFASERYNTTGSIMISSMTQNDIKSAFPAMQQICITGVAFDLGYYGNTLYGTVYLYFNNGQNGYMLVF